MNSIWMSDEGWQSAQAAAARKQPAHESMSASDWCLVAIALGLSGAVLVGFIWLFYGVVEGFWRSFFDSRQFDWSSILTEKGHPTAAAQFLCAGPVAFLFGCAATILASVLTAEIGASVLRRRERLQEGRWVKAASPVAMSLVLGIAYSALWVFYWEQRTLLPN